MQVGVATRVEINTAATLPEPGRIVASHHMVQTQLQGNLRIVLFGPLHHGRRKGRIVYIEHAKMLTAVFAPRFGPEEAWQEHQTTRDQQLEEGMLANGLSRVLSLHLRVLEIQVLGR